MALSNEQIEYLLAKKTARTRGGGDKDLTIAFAQTADQLVQAGIHDPMAKEIAQGYYEDKLIGGSVVEDVRKRLGKIRDILEEQFGHTVHLVSETYYVVFHRTPPDEEALARRCLPVGQGMRPAGIRVPRTTDDIIYSEYLNLGNHGGAGRLKKNVDRTLKAYEDGQLSRRMTQDMLEDVEIRTTPARPEIARQVRTKKKELGS